MRSLIIKGLQASTVRTAKRIVSLLACQLETAATTRSASTSPISAPPDGDSRLWPAFQEQANQLAAQSRGTGRLGLQALLPGCWPWSTLVSVDVLTGIAASGIWLLLEKAVRAAL